MRAGTKLANTPPPVFFLLLTRQQPYERRELSPFAQTVVELEAEFYAQFPEAKRAYLEQRSHQAALQGLQPDISGFEYYGESTLRLAPNYAEPVYFPSPESPIRSIPKPPPLHRLHSDHAPSLEDPRCTTIATLPSQPYGWSEQLEIGYAAPQNIVRRFYEHIGSGSDEQIVGRSSTLVLAASSYSPSIARHNNSKPPAYKVPLANSSFAGTSWQLWTAALN